LDGKNPIAASVRYAELPVGTTFTSRGIALRLFLSCWLIYSLHFASNIVREVYAAVALGDHLSFRLDDYAGMHDDIFEIEGRGWHHGANPGASMIAAMPYALARPLIDRIVERTNQRRAESADSPPTYNAPDVEARELFREAWNRGYDIKLGLAALVMQWFCMAPLSAAGVVLMFFALIPLLKSDRRALWFALLYAFGTPVFYRTGFINHNMMLGHFAFAAFLLLWNYRDRLPWSPETRLALAGFAAGLGVLLDYSGGILLLGLFFYSAYRWIRPGEASKARIVTLTAIRFGLGALGPVAILWFYQWQSFGHPFYPGQHWMAPVEWMDLGYQGFSLPRRDLLQMLLVDHRFGLFVSCPLFLVALAAPLVHRARTRPGAVTLATPELVFLLATSTVLWLFFGAVAYTRLQFVTGVRYLAPLFPFLFLLAMVALTRLPVVLVRLIAVGSITLAWSMAMYRDVERGWGVLDPVFEILLGGPRLPILTRLSRIEGLFGEGFLFGPSPLPLFALATAILFVIWMPWKQSARNGAG